MTKGLEYVREELKLSEEHLTTHDRVMLKQVEKELKRLEAIDNANPSQALECLEWLDNALNFFSMPTPVDEAVKKAKELAKCFDTIKQYILKAQEQEKVLEIVFEKRVDIDLLNTCEDLFEYNMHFPYHLIYHLTQEGFDLLKRNIKNKEVKENE